MGIDPGFFAAMSARLADELRLIRDDIFRVAGTEFNINSTPQLRDVLFERLGLPVVKRTKTGPSTDSSVLEELAVLGHELPRLMMDYRLLEKLRGTYVDALPALVNPDTRRIHTTFNQAVAATGRLSSSDPNLQNIPIRTDAGREIRKGFVAPEGALLLTADYSQIELRILAHFSDDEVFVRAFREGKDVHRATAAVIFDIPAGEVTGAMRDQAKTVNFATLYGQGPFGLARQLGIPMDAAKRFIAQYFERFAGVRRFPGRAGRAGEGARLRGHPDGAQAAHPGAARAVVERAPVRRAGGAEHPDSGDGGRPDQGGDDPHRGSCWAATRRCAWSSRSTTSSSSRWPRARVDEVGATVVEVMESAMELKVPLRVDVGSGRTWYDCKG